MQHYKTCILSLLDYDSCCHNPGSNTVNLYCRGNLKSYSQTRRREESRGMSSSSGLRKWKANNCYYMYSILNKMEKICVWCKTHNTISIKYCNSLIFSASLWKEKQQ